MDIFILGAGKPKNYNKPIALKKINHKITVLDWQINLFQKIFKKTNITFLSKYKYNEIKKNFPYLNIFKIPNKVKSSILNSFLSIPFRNKRTVIFYSDTIFDKSIFQLKKNIKYDLIVYVDTNFKNRYPKRPKIDLDKAEILKKNITKLKLNCEFTGILQLNEKLSLFLKKNKEKINGTNLIDLIKYIKQEKFIVRFIDIKDKWAEFNYDQDIARFILGNKAETLERLKLFNNKFKLPKQIYFSLKEWEKNKKQIINLISRTFKSKKIIIRSSSFNEDSWHSSNAGKFESFSNINSWEKEIVKKYINKCINSYKNIDKEKDLVLVQEFITNIKRAGVIFTSSIENGSPYYRINFDDSSGKTNLVTSGSTNNLRDIIIFKEKINIIKKIDLSLLSLLENIKEIERVLNYDKLDIEFAENNKDEIYIFQVRPIIINNDIKIDNLKIKNKLKLTEKKFLNISSTKILNNPFNYIFSNMSDWNPAEIIGTRPKPLSVSMYKYLITDDIWSKQRSEFGYNMPKDSKLMHIFAGQPYINVNLSMQSLIPNNIDKNLKITLLENYLNLLSKNISLHDKIEFEVTHSAWSEKTKLFIENLKKNKKISLNELLKFENSLKKITREAITQFDKRIKTFTKLKKNRTKILKSKYSFIHKIILLLQDCKTNGCLPFAHAARSAFISTSIMMNFYEYNKIPKERINEFFQSLETVNTEFLRDKNKLVHNKIKLEKFLNLYGHLRPGTYEIENDSYRENIDKYIDLNNVQNINKKNFRFNKNEKKIILKYIKEIDSKITFQKFVNFLKDSIKMRERIKLEFTKNISIIFDLLISNMSILNLNRQDLSFITIKDLEYLKKNNHNIYQLKKNIKNRRNLFNENKIIELPNIIKSKNDIYCFEKMTNQPNFITSNKVTAALINYNKLKKKNIKNKIILIENADPGFDWIFSLGLKGLITKYGGSNSHMSIRASELNLAAAIGVGDIIYDKLLNANRILLDCENKRINIL